VKSRSYAGHKTPVLTSY